jgi:hypothetical protein
VVSRKKTVHLTSCRRGVGQLDANGSLLLLRYLASHVDGIVVEDAGKDILDVLKRLAPPA